MDDNENKEEKIEIQESPVESCESVAADTKAKKVTLFSRLRKFKLSSLRIDISEIVSDFQENSKIMVGTVLFSFLLMVVVALAVFFAVVQGQEKVMVPNVQGKPLAEALLEMQVKELYPRIQLRYSEVPGDAGKILEQNPASGSIVKAGRRIALVVSRGVVIDHVENYTGLLLDDVRMQLQTLFAGSANPLIVLADPVYRADVSEPGIILEQTPPAGTLITEPVTVSLIVSRGPQFEKTRIPKIVGKDVSDMLKFMVTSKIIFEFTSHEAEPSEKTGTVTSQQAFTTEFVPNYTRMSVDFAFPKGNIDESQNVFGIFSESLKNYPYPVPMRVEAISPKGEVSTLISFKHTGGNFSIPYHVEKGTIIVLYVVDREQKRIIAE